MAWSVGEKRGETKRARSSDVVELQPSGEGASAELGKQKGKDLSGGMEILELDFLLSVVENTEGKDKNDVTMRRLNFDELIRRKQLNTIDSNALKVYAMNEGSLYGKVIQCEAMKELTKRTTHESKHSG